MKASEYAHYKMIIRLLRQDQSHLLGIFIQYTALNCNRPHETMAMSSDSL